MNEKNHTQEDWNLFFELLPIYNQMIVDGMEKAKEQLQEVKGS